MEMRINQIEDQLNNKMSTHPNLVRLWSEYIKIRKGKFERDLVQCEKMLENISNMDDPSPEQLLLTCHVLKMVFENTT